MREGDCKRSDDGEQQGRPSAELAALDQSHEEIEEAEGDGDVQPVLLRFG